MSKLIKSNRAFLVSVVLLLILGSFLVSLSRVVNAALISTASVVLTRHEVSTSTSMDLAFNMPSGESVDGDEILALDFKEDAPDNQWNLAAAGSWTTSDIDVLVEKSSVMVNMSITEISGDGTMDCAAASGSSDNEVQVDVNGTTGVVSVMYCDNSGNWTSGDAAGEVNILFGTAAGGTDRMTNSSTYGENEIAIDHNSGEATGEIEVPILDDDTVTINGYIDTVMTFDIDTSEIDEDCDADASGPDDECDSHSGVDDDIGYVVDLGEMSIDLVRESGNTNVMHSDGELGTVNYIWFDIATNANNGVEVTVVGANENDIDGTPNTDFSSMDGPVGSEIRSVDSSIGEVAINAGDGLYGLVMFYSNQTAGSILIDDDYDGDTGYGGVPSLLGGPEILFYTTGPVMEGRVGFTVAGAPDALDGSGTYSDSLTFIATATF